MEHREHAQQHEPCSEPPLKVSGVVLNDEAAQSIHDLRNTIERLTGSAAEKRRIATHHI